METCLFRLMNTEILLAAEGNPSQIASGFDTAQQFLRASEGRFTRFSEESELSELNRSAGRPFLASADLFEVLSLAQRLYHQTGGLFDPSILPDLRRAGYDRSLDLVLKQQGSVPIFESLVTGTDSSFSEMVLDQVRGMVLLPTGMSLDLGGIAKGWIAEQAAILLSGFSTSCAVNAGGDIFLFGLPAGEEQWTVAIEDPLEPEMDLTTIKVNPGAVATSSVTKRVWKQGEKERHHLIDPRTGEPAITEWLSMTVIASHTYEAEVFAKALLIGGPQVSERIAFTAGSQFSYLAIDRDRNLWGTHSNQEYLYVP
jgi:thiamine biosynthesis lipoprotein